MLPASGAGAVVGADGVLPAKEKGVDCGGEVCAAGAGMKFDCPSEAGTAGKAGGAENGEEDGADEVAPKGEEVGASTDAIENGLSTGEDAGIAGTGALGAGGKGLPNGLGGRLAEAGAVVAGPGPGSVWRKAPVETVTP